MKINSCYDTRKCLNKICRDANKISISHENACTYKLFFQYDNLVRFRENIRYYKSASLFVSFGTKIIVTPGRGTYCFRMQGQTDH